MVQALALAVLSATVCSCRERADHPSPPAASSTEPAPESSAQPTYGFVRALRPQGSPTRIVSLAPSATEILFSLGAGPNVVGVTRYCETPVEAKTLPKIGGFIDPSLEAIMGLQPQLVVTAPSEGNRKVVDRLVDLGVPVLLVPGTTLEDAFLAVELVGKALHRVDQADGATARMRAELAEVARLVDHQPSPRVLLLYDRKPLVAAGPGSFGDQLVRLAGGINVCAQSHVPYPTLSMETVLAWAPDVILDASMAGVRDATAAQQEAVAEFARFPTLPAVKNGRVLILPGGGLMRSGPSVGADVRRVAALIHPGVLAAP